MTPVEELKTSLGDLRALVAAHAEAGGGADLFKCPFHEDGSASFHVYAGGARWKCFAGCGGGDSIDFAARLRGLDAQGLVREFTATRAAGRPFAPARPARPAPAPTPAPFAAPASTKAGKGVNPVTAWEAARREAQAAGAEKGAALAYLARRLSPTGASGDALRFDLVRRLVEDGEVGVASEGGPNRQSDGWAAAKARQGYRLAVPLWVCPPPGAEVASPPPPCDMALRHVGPGDPPNGQKIMRLPGNGGVTPFYGYPPRAIAEADAGTLYVVEGALDYLTLRAAALAAVGVFAADYARRSGPLLRAEIEAVRAAGVGGPVRVVCVDQRDESSRAGMDAVAGSLAAIEGLRVERVSPGLEGRSAA